MSVADRGDGPGVAASCAAILLSISPTRVSARFHRNFQFRRDKPVLGIGGVILPEGPIGGVARSLEITHQRVADLVAAIGRLRLGLDGRCDRARLDDAQKRFLDGVVDAQAAEGDAARFAIVEPAAAQE